MRSAALLIGACLLLAPAAWAQPTPVPVPAPRAKSAAPDALDNERRTLVGLFQKRVEAGSRALAADEQHVVPYSSHHVEVQHGDDFVEREGRMTDEIRRPDQPFFFTRKRNENQRFLGW